MTALAVYDPPTTAHGRFWRRVVRSILSLGAAALTAKAANDPRLIWLTPVLQGAGKVVRDKFPGASDLVPF
jgi:hypothetical protein